MTATPELWACLKSRITTLRPEFSIQRIEALTASLQGSLTVLMAESWQRARRVIAQAAGDAQAISIIGPLSESSSIAERLMGEIDDVTLDQELNRRQHDGKMLSSVKAVQSRAILEHLAEQPLAELEPALDEMERSPERPTTLEYACVTTVKNLVRERCANLVAPVKHKIEKELSFELAATSEVIKPTRNASVSTVMNDNIVDLATQALHDDNVDAIIELLARTPNIAADVIRETLSGRNARGLVALAWKAGLPASLAAAVQIHLALIPPMRAILPSADGSYALTPRELNWQLDFLREKCAAVAA
ncbi:hypothetical protein [Acetobacter aceti]|nr:hypothetical protein [Acetobacter aceti]